VLYYFEENQITNTKIMETENNKKKRVEKGQTASYFENKYQLRNS